MQDKELVDMSFGTGAVKITPAHDPNDFKSGQRHSLAMINIFDDAGCINEHGRPFAGQPRFTARKSVIAALEVRFAAHNNSCRAVHDIAAETRSFANIL